MSTLRGYDAWVTREPPWYDDEPPVYRCCSCGGFLKSEPNGTREAVSIHRCDGQPTVVTDQHHDEAVLRILGEEHRDDTFTVCYAPVCGNRTATYEEGGEQGEISESEVESFRHEPHFFADRMGPYIAAIRVCVRCGASNEDPT